MMGWLAGVYVSDEWKITDRLTLNTGARFDQMWQYVNANPLSPRLSLSYSPFDGTTFHAGFARNFTPPAQVIAARPFVVAVARPAAGRSAFEVAAIAIAGVPQPTRARSPAVASSTSKEATSLMLGTRFENWPSEAY